MDERHMDQNDHHARASRRLVGWVCWIVVLSGLYLLSTRHYLLFHSIVEIATVAVAFAIFLIFWNSRRFVLTGYMLFLGVAYLFIGAFDLIHTLSYKGMGVFAGRGADLPTQLWIATRYMESLSFLVAPFFLRRQLRVTWVFSSYVVLSCLLLASIFFWKVFPVCFDDVQNRLTPFKEVSEFVIIGFLMVSLLVLLTRRAAFDGRVLKWISWSIVLTMLSELMFTRYTSPYEETNAIGHLLKLLSFYFVYKALIEIGLREPYELLYRELKQRQIDLQKARDDLEIRVQQRTAELSHTVGTLQEEVQARMHAEQRYRQSEMKFRMLVERVPVITHVIALDGTGATLYISPQVEPILGFASTEYTDDPHMWARRLHPDDRARVLAEMFRAREPDTPFVLEYRMLTRDNQVLWFRDKVAVVEDPGGKGLCVQGVMYDITTEKQMEQELTSQSKTLEAFFRYSITPLVILDRQFNFVSVNQAYADSCRRDISEFKGHNHFEFYPDPENQRIFEEAVRTKTTYQVQAKPFRFPDHPEWGLTYWDWTLVPILDASGEVESLVFSLKDVTVRRRAELALIEKEAYLRTVVSNAPIILFATDARGKVTVLEGSALAALKRERDELIGTNICERYRDVPDFVKQMRCVLAGQDVVCEAELAPGRTFDVRCSPLRDEWGEIAGIMGVALDITDAKRAEAKILADQEQLRALTAQLLRVEDQERRAIATELHDSVGQILAFIKIEMGELRRAELPAHLTQSVNHIREQINEAIKQTRSLTFEISPPELYTLGLEPALEELTQRFSQERQIECTVQDSEDPKPLSDQMKTLLYRSVRELLVNAAKHAQASHVHVTVDRIDNDIRIAVEDNGIGFDTSRLQDRSPHGTSGFGLFSMRERLTHMGGGVYIQSGHTKGTKVVLRAPLENGGSH
jgi:PAS domain S-box-containing protein